MTITTPPTIDPVPSPAPQRGDRTTFSSRVDAFVTWLSAAVAQFGALATNVYNNATESANFATASSNSATASANSATAAAGSATAAASSAGAALFSAATNYSAGQSAISNVNFRVYRRITGCTSTTDPANDPANWIDTAVTNAGYSARSGVAAQLVRGDSGKLIDITSGSGTQTIAAGSTLGVGWYVEYRVTSTSAVTIDPNGAEQIAGAATFAPESGGFVTYRISWDGAAFQVVAMRGTTSTLVVADQKASGTAGGGSVATTITSTRTFNTVETNTIAGASLASDEVTLPAGTYDFEGRASFNNATNVKVFLYNTADSTYTIIGDNCGTSTAGSNHLASAVGRFTITAAKTFKMRYYAGNAQATNGLGIALTSGQVEVYSRMRFTKVA